MNPNITKEMEPHTRQRFCFATSAFSRMYGVGKITPEMFDFCSGWAFGEEQAPLDCLNHVDRYFRDLWNSHKDSF